MASEVYADVSGTIPPQAQACPGLCPLCQCFPKPGFQTTCVEITEGNADSWALPQTYRIWISSRWRRDLHIIWAPQVILIHPSLRTSDADSGAGSNLTFQRTFAWWNSPCRTGDGSCFPLQRLDTIRTCLTGFPDVAWREQQSAQTASDHFCQRLAAVPFANNEIHS